MSPRHRRAALGHITVFRRFDGGFHSLGIYFVAAPEKAVTGRSAFWIGQGSKQKALTEMEDETLVKLVRDRVRLIPAGFVMSYGQVGDEVGCSAREAGWAMNQIADEDEAPWQRVVGSDGYLRIAKRSQAWAQRQRSLLEAEGVAFKENDCVDMAKHRWGTLSAEKTKEADGTLDLGLE